MILLKICPNICCFVYYDRLKQDSDWRGCRNRAYLFLSINFNDEIESYLLSDNSCQVAVLGNGTEYQHALDEDANPTGWCKQQAMSIFQPCEVPMRMVTLQALPNLTMANVIPPDKKMFSYSRLK